LNEGECSTRLNGTFVCDCLLGFDGVTCEDGLNLIELKGEILIKTITSRELLIYFK